MVIISKIGQSAAKFELIAMKHRFKNVQRLNGVGLERFIISVIA